MPKQGTKPESSTDATPKAKASFKAKPKTDAQPEPNPDVKIVAKAPGKPKTPNKPSSKSSAKPAAKPSSKPSPKPPTKPKGKPTVPKNPEPSLRQRYDAVRQRVADAAHRSGRRPDLVHVVAVTKYASPDQIRSLIDLGHIDLGESRVQQLTQRAPLMHEYLHRQKALGGADRGDSVSPPDKIRWHMIGQLQRNKVKQVLPLVQLVHSVDSLRLAEEIHAVAAKLDICVDVLLQVNISGEGTKAGVAAPAAVHLIDQMDTMVHLRPRGIMTMAPKMTSPNDAGDVRSVFSRCRECFQEIRDQGVGGKDFNVLSMGMTDDFEIAVEEGANVIRVGRAIFGDQEG